MEPENRSFRYTPKTEPISVQRVLRERHYVHRHVHMHDHNELLLITSPGRVLIFNNGNRCEVRTPALILHQAGSYHSTDTLEIGDEGYSCYCVFFYEQFLGAWGDTFLQGAPLFEDQCAVLELTEEECAGLLRDAERLNAEQDRREKATLLLILLLTEARDVLQRRPAVRLHNPNGYIFEVAQYLVEHFDEAPTAREIAAHFHVSVSKLTADFRGITGQTPKEFAVNLRWSRALELLRTQPGMKLAEIAYQCGFSSESYFIQCFQHRTGSTPNAYRRATHTEG